MIHRFLKFLKLNLTYWIYKVVLKIVLWFFNPSANSLDFEQWKKRIDGGQY